MSKKTWTIWGTAFLFTVIGTYNSVMIDSKTSIDGSQYHLAKRLDQEGLNRPARHVASMPKWQKLRPVAPQKQVAAFPVNEKLAENISASHEETRDLNLALVEVINSEKFKDGLSASDFSGILTTNGSQIETLEISLPEGLSLSVNYSEINGNVFEYELNGQTQSGMLYQVDKDAYMVSLTGGELSGTRLRFQATSAVESESNQEEIAQADVGQFGQEGYEREEMANMDQELQAMGLEARFNF